MGIGWSDFADYTFFTEVVLQISGNILSTVVASESLDPGVVLSVYLGDEVLNYACGIQLL